MKNIISTLILLLTFHAVFAVNVEGIVIDKDTNLPIVDAVILALSNNKVLSSSNTNINGEFKIVLKKGKSIRLEVVKNGYKTENADVVIDQAFIEADPFIQIKLQSKGTGKTEKEITIDKNVSSMEDVGDLSELPEGYKIIEAVPIKDREERSTGFNVRAEVKDQTTNVNVDVLKTEYNKELETETLDPNHNFMTSYFKEGAVYYNAGKAFLTDDVKEIIEGVALRLKNDETTSLKLTAYSDTNKELKIAEFICKMRIEEIVNILISEGVNFEQLDINVYGHQLIRNGCDEGVECSEEQHQENRKVELTFLK